MAGAAASVASRSKPWASLSCQSQVGRNLARALTQLLVLWGKEARDASDVLGLCGRHEARDQPDRASMHSEATVRSRKHSTKCRVTLQEGFAGISPSHLHQ